MERQFLESLGLEDAVISRVLEEHGRELDRESKRADIAEASLGEVRETLKQREYDGAVRTAVGQKGLKFSSKAAERDFFAQLNAKNLEVKDGVPVGLDEFIQNLRESDPHAFAPDHPVPQFLAPAGLGNTPSQTAPANVAQARAMGAERAAALKSSGEVLKNFL